MERRDRGFEAHSVTFQLWALGVCVGSGLPSPKPRNEDALLPSNVYHESHLHFLIKTVFMTMMNGEYILESKAVLMRDFVVNFY